MPSGTRPKGILHYVPKVIEASCGPIRQWTGCCRSHQEHPMKYFGHRGNGWSRISLIFPTAPTYFTTCKWVSSSWRNDLSLHVDEPRLIGILEVSMQHYPACMNRRLKFRLSGVSSIDGIIHERLKPVGSFAVHASGCRSWSYCIEAFIKLISAIASRLDYATRYTGLASLASQSSPTPVRSLSPKQGRDTGIPVMKSWLYADPKRERWRRPTAIAEHEAGDSPQEPSKGWPCPFPILALASRVKRLVRGFLRRGCCVRSVFRENQWKTQSSPNSMLGSWHESGILSERHEQFTCLVQAASHLRGFSSGRSGDSTGHTRCAWTWTGALHFSCTQDLERN